MTDIPGFLRYLSESQGGRQQLFGENLRGNQGYQNAPSSVRGFLNSRFNPLEAQYIAQGITDPGTGLWATSLTFPGGTPQVSAVAVGRTCSAVS